MFVSKPLFQPPFSLSQGLLWYKVYIYSKSIPKKIGANLTSKIRFCFISWCRNRPLKKAVRNAEKTWAKLATELTHPKIHFESLSQHIQYTVIGGGESNLNVSVTTPCALSFTCITIKLLRFQVQQPLPTNKFFNTF